MAGIFDLLTGGDPAMQIAARMGQGPGQPGSPAGPQPLAGPNAPPGGPSAPPAPPQPQVYQSPPDLAQMYMALSQHDQASNQFYNGLALLSAGMYPGRNPNASMRWAQGMQQDPNSMFNSLVQIRQMDQQQQSLDAFRRSVPDIAKQTGMTEDQILALGPQGAAEVMSKIAEANAGVGGGPAWMAQQRAEKALIAQGKPIPWTPGDPASYAAWNAANTGQAVTTAKTKADDLVADQHNFAPALGNYDKGIGLVDQFMTPDMQEGAKEFLGTGGSIRPVATMDAKGKAAWALYKQIMATQFAAGTQDFKGAGRITQSELTQDAPSQSTMGQLNQDPNDFFAGVQKYRDQLAQHRATLFGAAQKGDDPRLSDEDYTKYVAPNIDLFGGPKRNIKPPAEDGSAASSAASSSSSSGGGGGGQKLSADDIAQAKTLMARDGRDAVIAHLKAKGYDTSGL